MKPALPATLLFALMAPTLVGQAPGQSAGPTQREAMHKLAFLAGRWSGPVTIHPGPGEPLRLTQTESIEYKLDGLVLLVEGQSTSPDGKVAFSALATIAYDDASQTYRIRAYNDGHYVDTELTVKPDGFSWGFPAGPVQIVNTMQLTPKGEWSETTDATFPGRPAMRSVAMLLQHTGDAGGE